eukprot:4244804-Amphidinium_carterae.1
MTWQGPNGWSRVLKIHRRFLRLERQRDCQQSTAAATATKHMALRNRKTFVVSCEYSNTPPMTKYAPNASVAGKNRSSSPCRTLKVIQFAPQYG